MFGLDAGALEQKGQLLEAFLEAMGSKARKWLSRRDVPTSRRLSVATSPASRRWVNQCRSQQFKTSRRLNVATSQRRDVVTSRRQLEICTSSFKVRMAQKSGEIGRRTNEGTEFQSRVTQTSKECPGFVLFLIFVGY